MNTGTYGFNWRRAVVYNLVRIGPMYMNFMHVYVLCHKEGHLKGNLISPMLKVRGREGEKEREKERGRKREGERERER